MGEAACSLLDAEVALDRVDAEIAAELPAHMRQYARAYARGEPLPAAPPVLHRAATLEIARRALGFAELADRALAVLRLIVPTVLDTDPRVVLARCATPTWPAMLALARARDRAAGDRFGMSAVELLHRLHGADGRDATPTAVPPPIAAWTTADGGVDPSAITDLWGLLVRRHGGRMIHVEAGDVRPRTFVVEPKREVIVVHARRLDTPAARFALVHELGHALAAFLAAPGLPRAVDEAVAAYIARLIEHRGQVMPMWFSPHAAAARARRLAIAVELDALERALPAVESFATERPPWAPWHDPGAQAAYITAEAIAERWWTMLGPHPVPGALADALADERARIDLATRL